MKPITSDSGQQDVGPKGIYLKLVSEALKLDSTNGLETIPKATDIFSADSIGNPNLVRWASGKSEPTGEIEVSVYEMSKDCNHETAFYDLNDDENKLCLTPHQMIKFVRTYHEWLRKDNLFTTFLIKIDGDFFVVSIFNNNEGFGEFDISIEHFMVDDTILEACFGRRYIVPKQNNP